MLDIKLTPFILFMILLVVLVIAMIFGYNNNMVEGLVSESGNRTWTKLTSDTLIANYSDVNSLFQVYDSTDGNEIFFDPINGNIVSKINTDYSLLPRSTGVIVTLTATPQTGLKTTLDVVDPWSINVDDKYLVLYAPVENSVFVTIIDLADNSMVSMFKQSSNADVYMYGLLNAGGSIIPISTNTVLPLSYEPVSDLVDAENISINGETKTVYKIAKDIYYDKVDGICVKNDTDGTFNTSNDYKTRVSIQIVNTDVLVLSVLINDIINVNVITYDDSTDKKYTLRYSIQLSKPTIDQKIDDKISFTIDTGSDSDGYVKVINRLLDERTNGSSENSAPSTSSSSTSNDGYCSDPKYMLKTEIIPPVCPACPKCPESGCTLSINANGEIIDCNGKKYTSDDLYKAAGVTKTTSSDWKQTGESGLESAGDVVGKSVDAAGDVLAKSVDAAGNTVTKTLDTTGKVVTSTLDSAGNVISSSVGSAGELLEKTVDTAGNTVTKTIDTAGNTVTKTVDTAGNIINNTIDTTGDLVSGFGQGVVDLASGLGKGVYDLGKGTADVIKSVSSDATGLVSDTGSGLMKLSENRPGYPQQQPGYPQQHQPGYPPQQQPGYPPQQQPGYPQQQQPGYPQQQPGYDAYNGYGNYQTCTDQGSNYLPITNDFSQFA